jgi:hypothetical protein
MTIDSPQRRTDENRTDPVAQPGSVAQPEPEPEPRGADSEDSDAHLLRLCLDLQLDAMLLTLGAAAAAQTSTSGAIPFRRWVSEDVDLALVMAADRMIGRVALPPMLGTDLSRSVPAVTIDNLSARYTSMRDLLTDVLSHATEDDARHGRLVEALHHCQTRLVELREYRLTETPPRGLDLRDGDHQYLPGELLG